MSAVDLKSLIPAPRTANLGAGEAQVHGVTLEHLSVLLSSHADEIQQFMSTKEPDVGKLALMLPDLAVKLIAMGLRCEGQEDAVKQIPIATQIDILLDIWELSVPDSKKLMARLSGFSDALKKLASQNQKQSPSPSQNQLPSE